MTKIISLINHNGKIAIYIEKGKNGDYIIYDDDSKIKRSDFKDFKIKCDGCGKETNIKKLSKKHIEKNYLCRSCSFKGENNPMFGKKLTEEHKKILSDKKIGENNPFFGKTHTEETKNKISSKNKGKLSGNKNPMYNTNAYDLLVEKHGEDYAKEIWDSKRTKQSENMKGENNPFFGKTHTEENKEKIRESNKIFREENPERIEEINKKISNSLKGRVFSDEHKRKLRLKRIEQISLQKYNGNKIQPAFNPKACEFFDKISKEKNVYIQHAMNEGEYHIEELGYFLDGYDKENNIVYEYDEKHHEKKTQKSKDKKRQQEIEDYLKCTFIRIKEN